MKTYDTVYSAGTGEIEEKKSRFIAHVYPVQTEEEVLTLIEQTKKKYWDARHNCYAYVLEAGGGVTRCSDDGEPSGTAGRPILEVITGRELKNVLIIVTRYFGGTLLGTGGLVRAYTAAAKEGLLHTGIITKQAGRRFLVTTDYNGIGKLQYLAANLGIPVEDTIYEEQVQMKLLVAEELCEKVKKEIREITSGQAEIKQSQDKIYFAQIEKEVKVFEKTEH